MKNFFKYTSIGLLSLVFIYVVLCVVAPPMQVEKSVVIHAKDSTVFYYIADFRNWKDWSPWHERDPLMLGNTTYKGDPYTKGHEMEWKSKSEGDGRQVIVELKPYSYMKTALYFMPNDKPGYSEFILEPQGEDTKVTWNVKANMPIYMRGAGMLMGMNKMLGGYFSRGLERLKQVSEK